MYVSLLCLLQPHHRETVSSPRRSGRWYRLRVLGLHLPPSPCHPPSCALLLAQSRLVGARRHASSPSGLWLCFDQWGTLGGETESKRTWDVKDMRWQDDATLMRAKQQGIERSLFPELSTEEELIVSILSKTNDLQINIISVKSNIDISRLTSLLFQMEMKGIIRTLAGGMYHLLK